MKENYRKNEYLHKLFIKFGKEIHNLLKLWIIRILSFFLIISGAIIPNKVVGTIFYLISTIVLWATGPLILNYITEPIENHRLPSRFLIIINGSGILTAFGVILMNHISPNFPIGVIVLWSFILWLELSFEDQAWDEVIKFIKENDQLFPITISEDFIRGVKKIQQSIYVITLALFIIPIVIGLMLFRVGYRKIKEVMKTFIQLDKSLPYQKAYFEIVYSHFHKFCPDCKIPLAKEDIHCSNCGVELLTNQ